MVLEGIAAYEKSMSTWIQDSTDFLKQEFRKLDASQTQNKPYEDWYVKTKHPKRVLAMYAWYRQHGVNEDQAIEYSRKELEFKGIPFVDILSLPALLKNQVLVHPGVLVRKVTLKKGQRQPIGWIGKKVGFPERKWDAEVGKTYIVWAIPMKKSYMLIPRHEYDMVIPWPLKDEASELSVNRNLVKPIYWNKNSPEFMRVGYFGLDKRIGIERYTSFEDNPKAKNYEYVTFAVRVLRGGRMKTCVYKSNLEFSVNTGTLLLETCNGYYLTQKENESKSAYGPLSSSIIELDTDE